MKNKLPIILALVAALAAAAAGITARQQAAPPERRATATQAQHAALNKLLGLELADTSGTRQPLAQWKGKILVLNFWATWCPRAARRSRPFRP
jgi:cytochrome oxidase Cu insertion factor (SCO1/SenC/PrrC family)